MYDIAAQVAEWLDDGREVSIGVVVATRGMSTTEPGAALAWTPGDPPVGRLLGGIGPDDLGHRGLVDVEVSPAAAATAGLSCGGTASVLVLDAAAVPAAAWSRLEAREPLCLVTAPGTDGGTATAVYTPSTIRSAFDFAGEVPRLFARGVTATAVLPGDAPAAAIALWPVPHLVVVGDGLIADALHAAATLLGWQPVITPGRDDARAAITDLHRSDAVVVLSHDRAVDGPVLAVALGGNAGYIGALGSRRTQAARREWLTEHGVAPDDQDRIHGPAGLDIDAHTPAEIAVSIVAEILGNRGGGPIGALRDRNGPVHNTGVHAPPPRYGDAVSG
jgi:xanthine dehydrogenase accessory factor